jgi:hypothetical protein
MAIAEGPLRVAVTNTFSSSCGEHLRAKKAVTNMEIIKILILKFGVPRKIFEL